MSGGEKLGHKQEAAIVALLTSPTIELAAQNAGISDATLRRWMRDPNFQSNYRTERRRVVESSVARLQSVASEAVETLRRNLTCGTPSAEIAAARAVLDQSLRAVEIMDLAERIELLESVQEKNVEPKESH